MDDQIDPGLATIIAACIAIIGTIIGFIISQVVEYFRISREAKLRQKEKMIDKMIFAHELVIDVADSMMMVSILDGVEGLPSDTDVPVRGTGIIMSLDGFEEWWGGPFHAARSREVWLSIDTLREINYVQDYLVYIHKLMKTLNDDELKRLSIIVRQDFIDMSGSLRKLAMKFISNDAIDLKFNTNYKEWHKYKKDITEERLNKTKLMNVYAYFF